MGAGLDGRLYTDLSSLTPDRPITPTEKFYVRTRAIRVSGLSQGLGDSGEGTP